MPSTFKDFQPSITHQTRKRKKKQLFSPGEVLPVTHSSVSAVKRRTKERKKKIGCINKSKAKNASTLSDWKSYLNNIQADRHKRGLPKLSGLYIFRLKSEWKRMNRQQLAKKKNAIAKEKNRKHRTMLTSGTTNNNMNAIVLSPKPEDAQRSVRPRRTATSAHPARHRDLPLLHRSHSADGGDSTVQVAGKIGAKASAHSSAQSLNTHDSSPPRRSRDRNRDKVQIRKRNVTTKIPRKGGKAGKKTKTILNRTQKKHRGVKKRTARLSSRIAALSRPQRSKNQLAGKTRKKQMKKKIKEIIASNSSKISNASQKAIVTAHKKVEKKLKRKLGLMDVATKIADKLIPLVTFKKGQIVPINSIEFEEVVKASFEDAAMMDYSRDIMKYFISELNKELQKMGMTKTTSEAGKKLFWIIMSQRNASSHLTHPSLACASLWANRKKDDPWYEEEIKSVMRFIAIGALCEKCTNPFKLPKSVIAKKECICPKPLECEWKTVEVPSNTKLRSVQSLEEKRKELWKKQFDEKLRIITRGLKRRLIEEMGKDRFKTEYPYHDIPLSKREDQFGRDVFAKAKELNEIRMAANQCPTFFFSWTKDLQGNIGMPQQWILDMGTDYSSGAIQVMEEQGFKANRPSQSTCTGDCREEKHRCCEKIFNCTNTFNADGLLISKNGLFPCGIDGREVPRMLCEMTYNAVACDDSCNCTNDCPARTIMKGPQKMLILFRRSDIGWSIRTAETLVRGEYIFSFAGHVMTKKEIDDETQKQDANMFFEITPKGGWKANKKHSEKLLTITTDILANEFKYVNHSCSPNSLICSVYSRIYGELSHSVSLFARKRIGAFEEVFYDYYNVTDKIPFDCKCGGYACRG